jgi:hypothetical protein
MNRNTPPVGIPDLYDGGNWNGANRLCDDDTSINIVGGRRKMITTTSSKRRTSSSEVSR